MIFSQKLYNIRDQCHCQLIDFEINTQVIYFHPEKNKIKKVVSMYKSFKLSE